MDTATRTARTSSVATDYPVLRLLGGVVSLVVASWLLSTSLGYALPTVTGLAMAATGLFSIGSVLMPRLSMVHSPSRRLVRS